MEPNDPSMMREIYRLTRENNDMLHRMRRSAFLGGIVKFVFYVLILVVIPLWAYQTYLAPIMQNLQQTMAQVQGASDKTKNDFQYFQEALKQLRTQIPQIGSSTKQ